MKINKIIIAETEKIFLDFAKKLNFKNIKASEEIIYSEKEKIWEDNEEENIVLIYWKEIEKVIDFIKENYIVIEKIIIAWIAWILSNTELQKNDIIIPNTFISKKWETIFLDNTTIGKDYDMKKFWLILNGICSSNTDEKNLWNEFEADIKSEIIFSYLEKLKEENLLDKAIVVFQIEEDKDFTNLLAIIDMML